MADDLSSAIRAPRGIDLVAGRAGSFVRGQGGYVPASSGIQAAAFTTPWVEVAGHSDLRLDVVVSAITGGGSATVTVQTSFDAGVTDAAATVGAPGAGIVAAGTQRLRVGTCDRWVRASVALTGGTVTMSISGEAI